jgi:hypothetical protein
MRALHPFLVVCIALPAPGQRLPSGLAAPSGTLRRFQGKGFTAVLPDNWRGRLEDRLTSCAAPDGMVVTPLQDGGAMVTVMLGLTAGLLETSARNLTDATDQAIRMFQGDNPDQRVSERRPAMLGGLPAEAFQLEGPALKGGRERSWVVVTLARRQLFIAALTSPAQDFQALRQPFGRILDSIQVAP